MWIMPTELEFSRQTMDTSKIPSAWHGLVPFAHWLVQTVDPKLVVELGVDYGLSLIELARHSKGVTVGVDWFEGDAQTGHRNAEEIARKNVIESGFDIKIVKQKFDDAKALFEDEVIDILHIDGAHDYESVKHDFETWLPKVRSGGVILLHDTQSFKDDVGRFYYSLPYPKFELTHSSGLGVVTKL
jgi:predicted O-methyltransferase YrrM